MTEARIVSVPTYQHGCLLPQLGVQLGVFFDHALHLPLQRLVAVLQGQVGG